MQVVHYNEVWREKWDRYVMESKKSSIYHLIASKNVIEKSFGHKTFYLIAENSGQIKGVLPLVLLSSRLFGRFLVSLPFFDYGGICADDKNAEELLLREAIKIAEKEKAEHIEFHHLDGYNLGLMTKETKASMILELKKNPEDIWKNLKAKVRNQVRKAEMSGLRVESRTKEGPNYFYRIFAVNMRDLGTPVYSESFFKNILDEFPENTKIFFVYLGAKVIASSLTLGFRDTLEVPWAASLRKYRQLCPNMLLYWKMIEYACKKGYMYFDFGRSTWNAGTFRFKEQWGAKPRQLYWQYWLRNGNGLPEINPDNPKYRWAIKIWQKLPLFITTIIGPKIVKNLP